MGQAGARVVENRAIDWTSCNRLGLGQIEIDRLAARDLRAPGMKERRRDSEQTRRRPDVRRSSGPRSSR